MGDWLDPEVNPSWLARMLDTIRQCDQVEWILCTKRPELWKERMNAVLYDMGTKADFGPMLKFMVDWLTDEPPKNVTLLASVENQETADERIPALLRIPAARYGLSIEPLLGPVDLGFGGRPEWQPWIIIGGESGTKARPCNVEWVISLLRQGQSAGVPVYVKQLGANPVAEAWTADEKVHSLELNDSKGGDPAEWPTELRVREWPRSL